MATAVIAAPGLLPQHRWRTEVRHYKVKFGAVAFSH